jgi:hypothetical protein
MNLYGLGNNLSANVTLSKASFKGGGKCGLNMIQVKQSKIECT